MIMALKPIPKPDMGEVLSRIKNELDKKIETTIVEFKNTEGKLSKAEFFLNFREIKKDKKDKDEGIEEDYTGEWDCTEQFPISRDTYYNYSKFAGVANLSDPPTITVDTLFAICKYTGVSADYLLGFIECKSRVPSAKRVRWDFGLSDKSMEFLKKAHDRVSGEKGAVTASLINLILENSDFWSDLDAKLPLYISSEYYGYRGNDVDMLKSGLIRSFENFVDVLAEKISKSDVAPFAELDKSDPYAMI